ncbi:MAG: hypothetical protein IT405_00545 [Candidatus Yanofskybacteria bacterium]|nr:hypothetical protein [Candidatus Yanofskybacteria bacterium]
MTKISVCKTIAAHPQQVEYLCLVADDIKRVADLNELANFIRRWIGRPSPFLLKNEVFGDIVSLCPDDKLTVRLCECQRLSPQEVHELAKLLVGWRVL